MAKSIIKEMIIVLLLSLAIILVLGIAFYEYIPIAKTVPNEVNYTTPGEAKEELMNSETANEEEVILTYSINSSDLSNYKRTQKYKPGKANPFSSYQVNDGTNGNNNNSTAGNKPGNSNGESANNNGNNTGNTNNSSTEEGYLHNPKPGK